MSVTLSLPGNILSFLTGGWVVEGMLVPNQGFGVNYYIVTKFE